LDGKGIRIGTGMIVDAAIIHAPSSTKNFGERDEPLICLVVAYLHLRNKFFLAVSINREWIVEDGSIETSTA
jgi:hypothetical protein